MKYDWFHEEQCYSNLQDALLELGKLSRLEHVEKTLDLLDHTITQLVAVAVQQERNRCVVICDSYSDVYNVSFCIRSDILKDAQSQKEGPTVDEDDSGGAK